MNIEQERAEFEAAYAQAFSFAASKAGKFDRDECGDYTDVQVLVGWRMYQAGRAALQSQKPKANDLMLSAVIRMPFEMAMAGPISRVQFYERAQQALNELEALQSQDREDAERYRYIKGQMETGAVSTQLPLERSVYWIGSHVDCGDVRFIDEAIDHARRVEGER